ncbi:non-canonical purine NTP pyrophosphatase [Candidatus Saccharibacteria bacterium]|nr:non-canonical purine NTP pyrophosphatase [Candidatus Saccharibacteria bacterium]
MKPIFITGNASKAAYLSRYLGVELAHQKFNLDEIQSTDLQEIVEHKVRQAYELSGRQPVLVEDVALEFTALSGLPGPFIKFFVDAENGLEKLCRMLDSFSDRTATARCVFGYYDGGRVKLFEGSLTGVIANVPRGESGFGWDKIFCPDGYGGQTRAELTPKGDEETYLRIKPFSELKQFLSPA